MLKNKKHIRDTGVGLDGSAYKIDMKKNRLYTDFFIGGRMNRHMQGNGVAFTDEAFNPTQMTTLLGTGYNETPQQRMAKFMPTQGLKKGGRLYKKLQGGGGLYDDAGLLVSQAILDTEQEEPEVGTRALGTGVQRGSQIYGATGSLEAAAVGAGLGAIEGGLSASADKEKIEYEKQLRRDKEKFLKEQYDTVALLGYPSQGLEGATMYNKDGGSIKGNNLDNTKVEGGKLTKLADSIYRVDGNKPSKTDDVTLDELNAKVDNNEIMTEEPDGSVFVISDALGYADEAESLGKKIGSIKKKQNKSSNDYLELESLQNKLNNLKINQEMSKNKNGNRLYTKLMGGGLVPGQELYGGQDDSLMSTTEATNMMSNQSVPSAVGNTSNISTKSMNNSMQGSPLQAAVIAYDSLQNIGDSLAYKGKDATKRRERYKPINESLIKGQGVTVAREKGGLLEYQEGGDIGGGLPLDVRGNILDFFQNERGNIKSDFQPIGNTGQVQDVGLINALKERNIGAGDYMDFLDATQTREGGKTPTGNRGWGQDDYRNIGKLTSSYSGSVPDAPNTPTTEYPKLNDMGAAPNYPMEKFDASLEGDNLSIYGNQGFNENVALNTEPITDVNIPQDIQPETVEQTADGKYRVRGLDGSWRFIDNIHANKIIRDRERDTVPERGLEKYVTPNYANLDPLLRNVESNIAQQQQGVSNTNMSTASKQALLASNLATGTGLENQIIARENELNRAEDTRVQTANLGIDARNLASIYSDDMTKFQARDEIRQDKQRNIRDVTEDIGEAIRDRKAEDLVRDQNFVNLIMDDPRKGDLAYSRAPEKMAEITGMNREQWNKATKAEKRAAIQASISQRPSNNKMGGKLNNSLM